MPEENLIPDDPEPALPPGRRKRSARTAPVIPGYRIEGILARGSSATVYRARQRAVDREVALKVLHPELAGRKRPVMRLQREARTAARLAHPHIVSAIDMGEVDGLWWFAMELVHGPSLALRLRQSGALSEREALRLFIPLCEALVHLTEHDVVHRDIKPANILIDDSGGARLADLGLAFSHGDPVLTAQGGTLGTPHYISPEQACNPSAVDGRADLWSFGATFYHAVCGEPPFQGASLAEVLSGVLHARIPDPSETVPELSKGLVLVLRKCLSRDLALRYESPGQLLLDLERVRERRAPHINPRALEPVERRPTSTPVKVAAGIGLALLVAVIWFLSRDAATENPVLDPSGIVAVLPAKVSELVEHARTDSTHLAAALIEISAYTETAPESLLRELRTLESELSLALREELRGLRQEHEAVLANLIASRKFITARRALDVRFETELRSHTGYGSAGLPRHLSENRRAWRSEREYELERATNAAIGVLVGAAEGHYERILLPEIERDIERQAWRSARKKLGQSPIELIIAAGAGAEGIPKDALVEALAGLRSRLRVREDLLVDEWTRIEAGIHRWIERRAGELEKDLRSRRLRSGAAAVFGSDYEARLEQDGLKRDEFLVPEGAAVFREIERRRMELAELEQSLLSQETTQRLSVLEELFASKWPAREYESLITIWEGAREDLLALPASERSDWRTRHLEHVALEIRRAELLIELMGKAARGLERLEGERLELSLGNISVRGRIALTGDPMTSQFTLHARQGVHQLSLRELDARDLLFLAGIGPESSAADSKESRLVASLLSYGDGDFRRALTILNSGELPQSGVDARLVREMEDHAVQVLREENASDLDRTLEAQALLDQIDAARPGSGQLSAVKILLDNYGDIAAVHARARELRKLRARLLEPPPRPDESAYRKAFDPLAIEFGPERVRLIFEFGPKASRAWERGDWEVDWDAWEAPPLDPSPEAESRNGPRLSLRPAGAKLDISNELELRIDLEFNGPELITISTAGFHVSVIGHGASITNAKGWLVTSGSLEQHLEALQRGKGELAPFLVAGEIQRLEFVFRARSGRVSLAQNGEQLDSITVKSPRSAAESSTLQLQAAGGTRLRRIEVEARRP